jgi:hypothetical protein
MSTNKIENLTEFEKYYEEISLNISKYTTKKRSTYLDFLNSIYKYYVFMLFLADEKFEKFDPMLLFFTKTSCSIFGIYHLLCNGLPSDAFVILRSIFENLINLEVILSDESEDRLKLYYDYRHVERWLSYENNKKFANISVYHKKRFEKYFPSDKIEEIELEYEKIKNKYHPSRPYHWAWKIYKSELNNNNPNLKFLCGKLNRKEEYVRVYSTLSLTVHGSPNVKNIMRIENVITNAPILDDKIYIIGGMTVLYASQVTIKTLQYFDLSSNDKKQLINFAADFALHIHNYGEKSLLY